MRESSRPVYLRTVLFGLGALLLAAFVWYQRDLLFLAFAGLLVSIFLHAIASWIERRTTLNPLPSYFAALFLLVAVVVGLGLLLAPRVIVQVSDAAVSIPVSLSTAKSYMQRTDWGPAVLSVLHNAWQQSGANLTLAAKDSVQAVADLVVIFVIGFFGALHPRAYREGMLSLVPVAYREQTRSIVGEVIRTLRIWLLGQSVPMVCLGVASVLALLLLKVPLAFTLGLLTGVLIFVPYVGSLTAGVIAGLLALQRSPQTAVWVVLLYTVFHIAEGYFLTPLVQRKAVRLPPVLTILAQICFWRFGGVLGIAIAAPFAATLLVLVNTLVLKRKPRQEQPA